VWVHLDDADFMKNGLHNRHKVKGPNGASWLTVPVHASLGQPIREVRIATDQLARKDHWGTLVAFYRRAPYFDRYADALQEVYRSGYGGLGDLNCALLDLVVAALGLEAACHWSSRLAVASQSSQRILDLCLAVGARAYVSGLGGLNYMDLDAFGHAGVEVIFQVPETPPYPQQYPKLGFIPGLSIVDVLLNLGPDARDYVQRSGRLCDVGEARMLAAQYHDIASEREGE